jgi:hypothetical protein
MKTFVTKKLTPFLLAILILISCKKEKVIDIISNLNYSAEKTNVNTYEIISLSSNSAITTKYNGSFGTTPVVLVKTSDTTLAFIVPDVASGQYQLLFDSASIKFNVTKTQETNPDQLVKTIFQSYDSYVSGLVQNTAKDTAYVQELRQFSKNASDNYIALTSEQKKLTALFYTANQNLFTSFNDKLANDLDTTIQKRQLSECPNTSFNPYFAVALSCKTQWQV